MITDEQIKAKWIDCTKRHRDGCVISSIDMAIELVRWVEIQHQAEEEAVLVEIEKAYPKDIFTDTTQGERDDVIERYPGFIDRTSAMMGRHLVTVIRQKLSL
jgi:hypothetical protein